MSQLQKLKACNTLSDLARAIGYKPQSLGYFIHKFDDANKYTDFEIPKKSGGHRKISAPIPKLKAIQVRLAELLYDCIDEINLERGIENSVSHGFRRGKSIFTNADAHSGKRYVFNLDLEDFFPSINFGRVEGFFVKNANFQLKQPVALALAQLTCHKARLPQGAPTSPVISNLIGHILDMRLVKLAEKYGCTYTRYADDITFSTNKKTFPKQIAKSRICDENDWRIGRDLKKAIESCGFRVNAQKTRMQYFYSRQTVTGLNVNAKPNVSREYYKNVRAMCNQVITDGVAYRKITEVNADGEEVITKEPVKLDSIFGQIDHVFQAKTFGAHKPSFDDYTKPRGFLKTYQRLVFYDFCIGNDLPTIICEGRTDVVYLKSALKSLHKEYPALIQKEGGKFVFKVRFVNHYSRRARSLGIFDGADNLKSFVYKYEKLNKHIRAPRSGASTILLTDNDTGVMGKKKLFGTVAKFTGKPCDGLRDSYEIMPGLYLVPVPKVKATDEVAIESLFTPAFLGKPVKGKSLNYLTKPNPKTEFGKSYFADYVVKKEIASIDFKGFKPLLDAIVAVVT
ncbi:retron Ec67 family RNA-directed DNA polymerase/endonuclease [Qipengyuania sp. SS22]|uniref:retron Ec67 family RNA-directed DNA polymerase/endonuclease n=1 Tax=Qipengyuania sp. SS22 TaxID=2979461 RepID=UPI0021E57DA8|nr:retron Ec67 family RNA-directed DNA polymerase/endonuclease [Qipengyuania sp. SS22]UYH55556.1 retron Ec67 family RNA-directed DNA polymerase/endonuclease [Qipengyuania sp. SS22]